MFSYHRCQNGDLDIDCLIIYVSWKYEQLEGFLKEFGKKKTLIIFYLNEPSSYIFLGRRALEVLWGLIYSLGCRVPEGYLEIADALNPSCLHSTLILIFWISPKNVDMKTSEPVFVYNAAIPVRKAKKHLRWSRRAAPEATDHRLFLKSTKFLCFLH